MLTEIGKMTMHKAAQSGGKNAEQAPSVKGSISSARASVNALTPTVPAPLPPSASRCSQCRQGPATLTTPWESEQRYGIVNITVIRVDYYLLHKQKYTICVRRVGHVLGACSSC